MLKRPWPLSSFEQVPAPPFSLSQCAFWPGEAYGSPYPLLVYVCVNPVERGFEACDAESSVRVLEGLKALVASHNLSRQVFVTHSGCVLGCSQAGTTVALASASVGMRCYKGITVDYLPALLDEIQKSLVSMS